MSFTVDSDEFTAALLDAYRTLEVSSVQDLEHVAATAVEAAKRDVHSATLAPTIQYEKGRDEHGVFVEIQAGDRRSRAFFARFREFGTVKTPAHPALRPALATGAERFGVTARW